MLLYEWTREKHNRSFGIAAVHVISMELRDQKFSASRARAIVSTMAEATERIKLLADQIQVQRQQMEQQSQQHRVEMEQQAKYMEQQVERQSQQHRGEVQNLLKLLDVQKIWHW